MFFPRLRRQAKWVFVFLAVIFAGGFIFFGVGTGSSGLGDFFQGNFSIFGGDNTIGPSVSEARDKIEKNPRDARAWRDLSRALRTEGRDAEAIAALERYTRLRPRDTAALSELAGARYTRANELFEAARNAQIQAQINSPASPLGFPIQGELGQALSDDPITQIYTQRASAAYDRMTTAYQETVAAYKRLVAADPTDATAHIFLGETAQQVGDTKTALAAYKRFLKLAPEDANAALVRQRIQALQLAPAPTAPR